jgi:hypothetical protein
MLIKIFSTFEVGIDITIPTIEEAEATYVAEKAEGR